VANLNFTNSVDFSSHLTLTPEFNFFLSLSKNMLKAARPSSDMNLTNPRHWRGKWLHHLGGEFCAVSSGCCHSSHVDKYCVITLRLLFCFPLRLAPHHFGLDSTVVAFSSDWLLASHAILLEYLSHQYQYHGL